MMITFELKMKNHETEKNTNGKLLTAAFTTSSNLTGN